MKLFDHSNLSGANEDELREKLQESYKKELEFRKLQEDIKTSKYNRTVSIIALIVSIISIIISIIILLFNK